MRLPSDVRPPEESEYIPGEREVSYNFGVPVGGALVQFVHIALDLFQQRRITVPLEKAVCPSWRRRILHNFYKRESNQYVSYLYKKLKLPPVSVILNEKQSVKLKKEKRWVN